MTYCAAPRHAPSCVAVVADRTPLSDSSSALPGTHLDTCSLRPPFNTTLLGVARDLAAENIRYAELMVAPYLSVLQGIPPAATSETIEDARLRAGTDFGIRLA